MSEYDWAPLELAAPTPDATLATLPQDLAAVTRVLLGIPARTGARARVVEAPVIDVPAVDQTSWEIETAEPIRLPTLPVQPVVALDVPALEEVAAFAPLTEVEPLVADTPEPSSWDLMETPLPEPATTQSWPDDRRATHVLAELSFLDD
jgi:hypothetical protein